MTTILHICDWYRPFGGAEKLLFDTLDLLEAHGHRNIVVYNDRAEQEATGRRPEYACPVLESFVYYSPRVIFKKHKPIRKLEEIIRRHKPDVCHVHNLQNPFVIEYLVERIPCVRAVHDPRLYCFTNWKLLPDKSVCHHPLGPACLDEGCLSPGIFPRTEFDSNAGWILRLFRAHKQMPVLIGESRSSIDCLLDNGFSPEQIAWLPNFTPLTDEAETRSFVSRHFSPAEKIVLFVGRASYEKGPHVLLKACRYIRSRCRVVFITAGPLLEEIQDQAENYPGRITVIPGLPYEETRVWYARASVVVVPSVWLETFCLVGLEAYSNMKPVIGSRIGGIPDWLKERETGWFFDPGNPKDLAEKIDTALEHQDITQEIGCAGYRRAAEYYNPELYLQRLLEIYQRAQASFRKSRRS